jgi:hypothetical protein
MTGRELGATLPIRREGARTRQLAAMCQALGISADEMLGLEVSERRAAEHLAREAARLVEAAEKLSAAALARKS